VIRGENKALTDKREYGKTTFDRAYLIVCKAKMKEKWRLTQFRKIRFFFESKGIKHVNDVAMTHADEYANWITSMYDKPSTRRGLKRKQIANIYSPKGMGRDTT